MKWITDGIASLDLVMPMGDHQMEIHPTLVWDDKDVVLIDTGLPGMITDVLFEMEQIGVPFERLSKVVLTHQDYDHIGGLPDILSAVGHPVEVIAHIEDQPYIQGERPLIKHDDSRAQPPTIHIDTPIDEGDVLPILGGLKVIFTPGHTPGHMSLYHIPSKTLITGDATVARDGKLLGPNEAFTPDLKLAWKSFARFVDFDVKRALCYHGGLCDKRVNEQIRALAKETKEA